MSRLVFISVALGGVTLLGLNAASGQMAREPRPQNTIHRENAAKKDRPPPATSKPLILKTLAVEDTFLKQTAFTVLVPKDWQAEGKIHWRWHPIYPATGSLTASNPKGVEAVQFYPNLPFVDGVREAVAETAKIAGPQAVQFAVAQFPEGANYMGNEVRRQPNDPADYLAKFLLPRQRPDIKQYKIVATEDMPKWAKASAYAGQSLPGVVGSAQATRIRIEYTDSGHAIQEDFFILLPRVTMQKLTFWGVESASSVRAEKGKLDDLHKLHQAMLFSTKLDLKWYARERQVAEILQDMVRRQQKHTMEISRIIAQTNAYVSQVISDSYWNRQKTMDQINYNFSQYIRGVQSYVSPYSAYPVELPSGYNHAWVNSFGEYILSNDSFFDPNQSLSGTWQKLQPK